ncbi:alanine/glycine:cation symporter family protein [Ferrimonas balearica]|uniref:alanine/glycine:cation symporter family protein n=1 Tax=Ferrimonas balearica TaxID=44012 RepID=UPI001F42A090|nr:sodium:alanine symporter family protein [Ferrimonas balearica]MBY6018206.1 sodium:alanine symporter family protein [Halomonas denitrificans]MBY6094546.1 sodium:alanine symporter family protein [Ferrimonas balearica]
MNSLENALATLSSWVWGPPLLILLLGTGLYFTINLGMLQLRGLPLSFKLMFQKSGSTGDVSRFSALCTALAATIGTGNIVGVATAVKLGGPGALFWMWLAGLLGMATKYAECMLAVKYRRTDDRGEQVGGPMYYIAHGTGLNWLAKLFALFTLLVAFFGIGTFPQVNAIVDGANIAFAIPNTLTMVALTVLVAAVVLGGIKRIATVATALVPTMAIGYVLACSALLLLNWEAVPGAFALIFESAFNPVAAGGGFAGATVMMAIQFGIARGVFSNEAGLGSAPMAAAAAKTESPVEQGLVSMMGPMLDTLIICTLTGLALVMSGAWQGDAAGAAMTSEAFNTALSSFIGTKIITVALLFFAFTTILGWCYYGERAVLFLVGERGRFPYRVVFVALVAVGGLLQLELIWLLADVVNGLMAVPNLIALLLLRKEILADTRAYLAARAQAASDPQPA